MNTFITKTIFLLVFICVTARSSNSEENVLSWLREPNCTAMWLLVELPVKHNRVNYELSTTHALVKRCMGVNNKKKACVSVDKEVKNETFLVENVIKNLANQGNAMSNDIIVSWISHEECGYKSRKDGCPIGESRRCHAKSTTHYYDEVNCTCTCIVKIDGEETCRAKALMEFSHSEILDNSPKSKIEKPPKKSSNKKCWKIPKLLSTRRIQKSMSKKKNKWPLLDPIPHLIIEAGTTFIILRWQDPPPHKSGVTIESFRINWMSKNENIKSREIEAQKMENPERKICIQDLDPDRVYAVAIFIKVKSEGFFSRPTIRTVKTLSSNEDSMIFQLGDIGGSEL